MNNCEDMGLLLSVLIDDELSDSESLEVRSHVAVCDDCQRRLDAMVAVDSCIGHGWLEPQIVQRLGLHDGLEGTTDGADAREDNRTLHVLRGAPCRVEPRKRSRTFRSAPLAIAASLVLVASVTVWLVRRPVGSDRVVEPAVAVIATDDAGVSGMLNIQANEGPIRTLRMVSQQQRQTQDVLGKALQWDLRILQMEVNQMNVGPAESERLNERIGELLQRIEQTLPTEPDLGDAI